MNKPFIEFAEKFNSDGSVTMDLVCHGFNFQRRDIRDFRYRIIVQADGRCEMKSRANGRGSVRYYNRRSVAAAMEHGIRWATRKARECTQVAA
jgi:hypothetical protein